MSLDLATIELKKGGHLAESGELCLMEAIAHFAGEPHGDRPACTDSVVASYARALNDEMSDDQRQRLISYIPRLAATSNGMAPVTRAYMCADRAVRVFAPLALDVVGLPEEAAKLRALHEIDSRARAAAAAAVAGGAAALLLL